MTNGNSSDRLDRIERILEQNALRQERMILEQESAQQRITSIERTVQAMLEQRASDRLQREEEKAQHEERMARLEENLTETRKLMAQMTQTQQGLTQILIGYDEDRPTILRRLMTIENKVDRILDRTSE